MQLSTWLKNVNKVRYLSSTVVCHLHYIPSVLYCKVNFWYVAIFFTCQSGEFSTFIKKCCNHITYFPMAGWRWVTQGAQQVLSVYVVLYCTLDCMQERSHGLSDDGDDGYGDSLDLLKMVRYWWCLQLEFLDSYKLCQ